MILLLLSILPALLWDESPTTAPELQKAGIQRIAVTGDAGRWSGSGIEAVQVDAAKMVRLDPPGVDYKAGVAGATAAPWINSNLWRMIRDRDRMFLYDAVSPLAMAEGYAGGARTYFRVKRENLEDFAAPYRTLEELDGPPLPDRTNFDLVDDRSPEIEEIMNLLVRRNLLFEPVTTAAAKDRMQVKIGSADYPKAAAEDPYVFAAMVRSRIGDDNRLVRLYGSETTLVRLSGDKRHARLNILQYGQNPAHGLRVRVLGRYPRVYLSEFGQKFVLAQDAVVINGATEFSIAELKNFAVVDLEASEPGVLHSSRSEAELPLTADPESPFWRSAPRVTAAQDLFAQPTGIGATEIRSRWTRDSLYLLYTCPFERLHVKPDPVTDRDTPLLWDWDVAEAFIGIQGSQIDQYREFEMSPQGEWVDLDIDLEHPKADYGMGWNSGFSVKARLDREHKVWYGEMRIPMSSLPAASPKPGDVFRLGLYRIAGPPPGRIFGSWQPIHRRSYHTPESFGTLVLDAN
jgi:hypothetical protein